MKTMKTMQITTWDRLVSVVVVLLLCISTAVHAQESKLPDLPSDQELIEGGIPRIIHQVWLPQDAKVPGRDSLLQHEAHRTQFHSDWRRSCQVHNPGWRYMLWDVAASEALLAQHYPEYLARFKSLSSRPLVVRGDAIRSFILHHYGGLYMDMDTECYGPVEPSLKGHSLVLQAQLSGVEAVNSQMATARGHPFWLLMQARLRNDALYPEGHWGPAQVIAAGGPAALTGEFRAHLNISSDQRVIVGVYKGMLGLDNLNNASTMRGTVLSSTVRVYASGEWFNACDYNADGCHEELAYCAPIIRTFLRFRMHNATYTGDEASPAAVPIATRFELPDTLASLISISSKAVCDASLDGMAYPKEVKCICSFKNIVGGHHFSGSWLGPNIGYRPGAIHKAEAGIANFFSHSDLFQEVNNSHVMVPSQSSAEPMNHVWVREALASLAQATDANQSASVQTTNGQQQHNCHLLSITQVNHPGVSATPCSTKELQVQLHGLHAMVVWAQRHGCHVSVFTDLPEDHQFSRFMQQHSFVSVSHRSLVFSPTNPTSNQTNAPAALSEMLDLWQAAHKDEKLSLLHLSCPGNCTWQLASTVVPQIPKSLLHAPPLLLLDLGPIYESSMAIVPAAYQTLYQELGYVGYFHHQLLNDQSQEATGLIGQHHCWHPVYDGTLKMPALRLGFMPVHVNPVQWEF